MVILLRCPVCCPLILAVLTIRLQELLALDVVTSDGSAIEHELHRSLTVSSAGGLYLRRISASDAPSLSTARYSPDSDNVVQPSAVIDIEGGASPVTSETCVHQCCLLAISASPCATREECEQTQSRFMIYTFGAILLIIGITFFHAREGAKPKLDAGAATEQMNCGEFHKQFTSKVTEASAEWKDSVMKTKTQTTHDTQLYEEHAQLMADAGASYVESIGSAMGAQDALIIVDMQNDFLPGDDAPLGGRFGVAEGATAADVIVKLIQAAEQAGTKIIATRNYHPKNHCSFNTNGGIFPPHCIQGSPGSFICEPIEKALNEAKGAGADVSVVFKGFLPQCDSFGCFTYTQEYFSARQLGENPQEPYHSCCAVDWTGCFSLTCSNIDDDLNAPPDVCAVLDRVPLKSCMGETNRLFGTGLALDFCVLDTLLNASAAGVASGGTYLVADAARAAYVPGVGQFGSGFLTDPSEIVNKMKASNVQLVKSDMLLTPAAAGTTPAAAGTDEVDQG